jgi:uncharacterized protein YjbI with pentapeptide repeats
MISRVKRKASVAEIERLRGRWGGDGVERRDGILRRLVEGPSIGEMCERTDEGLYDLRGFAFPRGAQFRGVAFSSIDFSYASTALIGFHDCTFSHCSFAFADLDNFRLFGGRCFDVSFERADLRGCGFGGRPYSEGCSFEHVRFNQARMTTAGMGTARFVSCDFSNAAMNRMHFRGPLRNCLFAGRLSDVWFENEGGEPDYLVDCDFRTASFSDVHFDNFDFKIGDVSWPQGTGHYVVTKYLRVLSLGRAALESDPRDEARTALIWLNGRGRRGEFQEVGCFSSIGLERHPLALELFEKTIRDAVATCDAEIVR